MSVVENSYYEEQYRSIFLPVIILVGVIGVFAILYAGGEWGIGVSHDSVFYLSSAENLINGDGLFWTSGGGELKPLVHFPPLYPLLLSASGFALGNLNHASTILAALFFGVNVLIAALLISYVTQSKLTVILGAMIVVASPILLNVHLETMSEPLFLALTLIGLGFTALYIKSKKRRDLIIALIAASGSFLTRYIGVSVILTCSMALLFWYPASFRRRVWEAFRFGIIASIPNVIWYSRNYILTGSFTNRVLTYHPIPLETLRDGLNNFSTWFLSEAYEFRLRLISLAILLLLLVTLFIWTLLKGWKQEGGYNGHPFISILILFGITYSALLIFSLTFIDASTPLSNRILSPLYLVGLILTIMVLSLAIDSSSGWWRRALLVVLMILFFGSQIIYAGQTFPLLEEARINGRGFNSKEWKQSEIVSRIQEEGMDVIIYSNEAFPIFYLTGVPSYWVPEKYDPVKATVRDEFDQMLTAMKENLETPDGALVLFHSNSLRPGMPSLDEITGGLVMVFRGMDGEIYVSPGNEARWLR